MTSLKEILDLRLKKGHQLEQFDNSIHLGIRRERHFHKSRLG